MKSEAKGRQIRKSSWKSLRSERLKKPFSFERSFFCIVLSLLPGVSNRVHGRYLISPFPSNLIFINIANRSIISCVSILSSDKVYNVGP